jgi:hypothetical protein
MNDAALAWQATVSPANNQLTSLNLCRSSIDGMGTDPPIDTASIISDQEPVLVDRLDQVQIDMPFDLHQDNITHPQLLGETRLECNQVSVIDFPGHRVAPRFYLRRLSCAQLLYGKCCPIHVLPPSRLTSALNRAILQQLFLGIAREQG